MFLLATVTAVSCLGIITRNSCPALYQNILMLATTTLAETFGLILLEKLNISQVRQSSPYDPFILNLVFVLNDKELKSKIYNKRVSENHYVTKQYFNKTLNAFHR